MAVAEDQRVGRGRQSDVWQQAWRRTFAKIEHQAFILRLDGKAGGALFADPRNKPQHWPMPVHDPCSFVWARACQD
jgi:hypothetical protein